LSKAFLATATCLLLILAPIPGRAFGLELASAGIRASFSSERVLGKESLDAFREYDVWGAFRLPSLAYDSTHGSVRTRLLASAGYLEGGGSGALAVSVLPLVTFGTHDGRFLVDLGAGLAVLSQSKFGQQDFGGPVQFALTFGASVPLYRQFGVGYRFMHYSDAGAYGSDTVGADMHMLELVYRF